MNAQEIFDAAFSGPRDPRSHVYKQGVMACLLRRTGEAADITCPYCMGTVEADAWWAGWEEGALRYRIAVDADADRRREEA